MAQWKSRKGETLEIQGKPLYTNGEIGRADYIKDTYTSSFIFTETSGSVNFRLAIAWIFSGCITG